MGGMTECRHRDWPHPTRRGTGAGDVCASEATELSSRRHGYDLISPPLPLIFSPQSQSTSVKEGWTSYRERTFGGSWQRGRLQSEVIIDTWTRAASGDDGGIYQRLLRVIACSAIFICVHLHPVCRRFVQNRHLRDMIMECVNERELGKERGMI
jgi:hypothetical protein